MIIIRLFKKSWHVLLIISLGLLLIWQENNRQDIQVEKDILLIENEQLDSANHEIEDRIVFTEQETDSIHIRDSIRIATVRDSINYLTRTIRRQGIAFDQLYGQIEGDTVGCYDSAQQAEIVRTGKLFASAKLTILSKDSIIDNKDVIILSKDSLIENKDQQIANQTKVIEKKDNAIQQAVKYFDSHFLQFFRKHKAKKKFKKIVEKG